MMNAVAFRYLRGAGNGLGMSNQVGRAIDEQLEVIMTKINSHGVVGNSVSEMQWIRGVLEMLASVPRFDAEPCPVRDPLRDPMTNAWAVLTNVYSHRSSRGEWSEELYTFLLMCITDDTHFGHYEKRENEDEEGEVHGHARRDILNVDFVSTTTLRIQWLSRLCLWMLHIPEVDESTVEACTGVRGLLAAKTTPYTGGSFVRSANKIPVEFQRPFYGDYKEDLDPPEYVSFDVTPLNLPFKFRATQGGRPIVYSAEERRRGMHQSSNT